MKFKLDFKIYLIFSALIFSACGGEKVEDKNLELVDQENVEWADSIFGKLSEKNQYYQHLIIKIPQSYQAVPDSLSSWILVNQPGAIQFENWNVDSIQKVKNCLDTHNIIQPFFYSNYFDLIEIKAYPFWEANAACRDLNYTEVFSKAGYQLLNFDLQICQNVTNIKWLDSLYNLQGINAIANNFSDENAATKFDAFTQSLRNSNFSVHVNLNLFDSVQFNNYRQTYNYDGLFIVNGKEKSTNILLGGGADFLFKRIDSKDQFLEWKPSNEEQEIFEASTKRILMRKAQRPTQIVKTHPSEELRYVALNMQQKGTAIIKNTNKLVPFKSKFTFYTDQEISVDTKIRTNIGLTIQQKDLTIGTVDEIIKANGNKVVVLSDSCSMTIVEKLANENDLNNLLIGFQNPTHYSLLSACPNLFFCPSLKNLDASILVQQLSSRLNISGNYFDEDSIVKGKYFDKKVLARTSPNFVGMDKDTLAKIGWAVNNAMSGRAFPGCQVLLAKDGCIIYDRSFGHHEYNNQVPVTENSLYDLASVTKIVSTTMVGMKLYEMNAYKLNDSLGKYLPDSLKFHLRFPSTIRNITFQELFIHKSGMPSGFPIIKYMRYTNAEVGRFDKYFCDRPDSVYNTEVAENFYLEKDYQDTMWLRLNQIFLNPKKDYNYSDVNMNTLYFMFKSMIQKNPSKYGFTQSQKQLKDKNLYAEFLYNTYYKPLGMEHTCYKPLKKFGKNQIVPTENETYWRKQLLHGHVHDPNAALHGGIAGNAGIFSTTNDLAILCQMLLNKGVYNGQRYLNAETIEKFTSKQENSHRGLGFNKPAFGSSSFGVSDDASLKTYGHTGFTGTCIWVDPETQLTFIFLSNRVNPDVNNRIYQYGIRKRIHQIAYDAMMVINS